MPKKYRIKYNIKNKIFIVKKIVIVFQILLEMCPYVKVQEVIFRSAERRITAGLPHGSALSPVI